MKKIITTALLVVAVSTSAATASECSVTNAATNTAVSGAVGAGIGAAAGVAAVWTVGVLAAPFTLGGSIVAAGAATLPAVAFGAKGGAVYGVGYGAGTSAIDCIRDEGKDQ